MFFKKNVYYFAFFVLFLLISFFPWTKKTDAQIDDINCFKKANLVFRDANGNYIPGVSFNIYRQVADADGKPKPGTKKASKSTSAITGIGSVCFQDKICYSKYAIEAWKNSKIHFYFYDVLSPGCFEKCPADSYIDYTTNYLSSIKVTLRDTEGRLLKNHSFTIYSQRYDADGKPIKEKQDLVGTFNTSEEGEAVVYVPNASKTINGDGASYYIFESNEKANGIYRKYDIYVGEDENTDLDFVYSDMRLNLKDYQGVSFPANTKLSIYRQEEQEGKTVAGKFIKDIYTDDDGYALFKYPAGIYVAKLEGKNKSVQYFWDLEVIDQERTEYDLQTKADWQPSKEYCDAESTFTLITKNLKGEPVPGLHYELYEQVKDVNGVPSAGGVVFKGVIDQYGRSVKTFHPSTLKRYAIKIWDKNPKVGDFWFFDSLSFYCGEDKEITKSLPSLTVILRNGDNTLKKNHKFSIYTQKYDADGSPIREKEDLVIANLNSSAEGMATIYVAPDHPYKKNKHGSYVFVSTGANKSVFEQYYITIKPDQDYLLDYIFSDLYVGFKDAGGKILKNKSFSFNFQKKDIDKHYTLGKAIKNFKTDSNGRARIEYHHGRYAISFKDSLGKPYTFWNIDIKNRKRVVKDLTTNLTNIYLYDGGNGLITPKTPVNVYSLVKREDGFFYKDKKIKSFPIGNKDHIELILAKAPYLFTVIVGKSRTEYGGALYIEEGKEQRVNIKINKNLIISKKSKFALKEPPRIKTLAEKLAGYILLQVENNGEAWYVNPKDEKRYYMKNGAVAYEMMRKFGLGISNANLEKIPMGIDDRFEDYDYDGDMVSDKMEEAIGTDVYLADTDGDGYDDGTEIKNDFNPKGEGKMNFDYNLANHLKGKILLQVESRGEAWYVNPKDGRRYYMKDGESAYQIMRYLSLGIKNVDLEEVEMGNLNNDN